MNVIGALHRRVMMALGLGQTTQTSDESGPVQTLQISVFGAGSELHEPLPSMQHFGFASAPMAGAHHALIFVSGDRTKGVAVASNDPRYRPTGMKPGEVMIYDALGRQIYFRASGGILIQGNGSPITVDGDLYVTGEVVRGYGTGASVTLGGHRHDQPADGAGDAEAATTPPIAGT